MTINEVADYDATLASQQGHLWIERGNQNDANPAFLPNLLYTSIESGNAAGVDYAGPSLPARESTRPWPRPRPRPTWGSPSS